MVLVIWYKKTNYKRDGFENITEKDVSNQLLDKIIFPNLMLPDRPVKLTSNQTFKIIRKYVQNNIDPKVAVITSDHNFCFTVKKKIKLIETEHFTYNVNLFTKRKPKYKKGFRIEREVECFEMTFSPENYGSYTPIPPFEGKNQEDLKTNIDKYLLDLITKINEPVCDCPNCKGLGVIIGEKK